MTGNAFQTFFGDVMEARYGDDFVRVKPYGSLGDKGCDGYLQSSGAVYACYGAQNGAAGSVSSLVSKIDEDFDKALKHLGSLMTEWRMAHNIIEGMPTEALLKKAELEKANPELNFEFYGPPNFKEVFSKLSDEVRQGFLGPAAQNQDYQLLQLEELSSTVDAIISAVDGPSVSSEAISPVSPKKLAFNELSGASRHLIKSGRVNEPHIDSYFGRHPNPLRGQAVATVFRSKYEDLRAHGLSPDAILAELFLFVAGTGEVSVPRQVACHSLLSYLFERCDIFENAPSEGDDD